MGLTPEFTPSPCYRSISLKLPASRALGPGHQACEQLLGPEHPLLGTTCKGWVSSGWRDTLPLGGLANPLSIPLDPEGHWGAPSLADKHLQSLPSSHQSPGPRQTGVSSWDPLLLLFTLVVLFEGGARQTRMDKSCFGERLQGNVGQEWEETL